jgi:hypothetical protein
MKKGKLSRIFLRTGFILASLILFHIFGNAACGADYKGGWSSAITASEFSPDGNSLLIGSREGGLELWDVRRQKIRQGFAAHKGEITAVASSPDGRFAISAGNDGAQRLWRISSGKEAGTAAKVAGRITAAAICSDTRIIALAGEDKTLHVVDRQSGKMETRVSRAPFRTLRVSPDGAYLVAIDNFSRAYLFSLPSGSPVCNPDGISSSAAEFSPQGPLILARRELKWFDPGSCAFRQSLPGHRNAVTALAISRDGKTIVSGGRDAVVRVRDTAAGKETRVFPTYFAEILGVAVSGDNRYVMAWMEVPGTVFKLFQKWDLSTGEEIPTSLPFVDYGAVPAEARPVQAWGGDSVEMEDYTDGGGYFEASVPKAWTKSSPQEGKGMGLVLAGPMLGDGLRATLTLSYVDTGRKVARSYSSAEKFLEVQSGPVLGWGPPGEEYGEARDLVLAGRQAKMLDRKVFHFIPSFKPLPPAQPGDERIIYEKMAVERIPKGRNVLFYEKSIVIPSGSNFYLLRLECPAETAKHYDEAFERVLKTFTLLK